MTRILITGANGLVGQTLARKLADRQGVETLATSASDPTVPFRAPIGFQRMDITDAAAVGQIMEEFRPDAVIHCAAVTQVDLCEEDPERCDVVNIEGTRITGRAAESVGAMFIYLSTDFVFDGECGPYAEEDQPNPVNQYGWSKLQGEFVTRSLKIPWSIVRTILVYGFVPHMVRPNLVTWVKDSLEKGIPVRATVDHIRMPTLADDLADGIIRIACDRKTGIFHLSGCEMMSVYDFARLTARSFGFDETLITPVSSAELAHKGKRPRSTGFILDKAVEVLEYSPRNVADGIALVRNLLAEERRPESSPDNRP